MLRSFPQSGDPDLVIGTYVKMLAGYRPELIDEAARAFMAGTVDEQSVVFAPSLAAFVTEVRRRSELKAAIEQARALPPPSKPAAAYDGLPFERRRRRAELEHGERPILFEDVDHNQWRRLSANKEVPAGAVWVAALGIVYGPNPNEVQAMSEAASNAR
jgi:hypothetical protein